MLRLILLCASRDCALAWQARREALLPVVFFLVVATLFPLGTRVDEALLRSAAPAVLWMAALLAGLMPLQKLFAADLANGVLEQMVLVNEPLAAIAIGRIAAHWLASGLPLVLVAPLVGLQYGLPSSALLVMALSLLIGTPALSVLGAVGAALTLQARGGSALLALLVLPLCVPVLVLGASALDAAQSGMDVTSHLMLLGACSVVSLALGPPVLAAAWRLAVE